MSFIFISAMSEGYWERLKLSIRMKVSYRGTYLVVSGQGLGQWWGRRGTFPLALGRIKVSLALQLLTKTLIDMIWCFRSLFVIL
jgi:hypothetical protein